MSSRVGLSASTSVALAFGLAACTAVPSSPAVLPSTTSAPSAPPSAMPSPTPAPVAWSSLTWSKGSALPDGQFLADLLPWRGGSVGVGGLETATGLEAGFLTSTDGSHWTLASHQATAGGDVYAAHVVALGNRLLAAGQAVMSAPGEKPAFPPPLWASDDGTTWTRLTSATWDAAFTAAWPAWLLAGPQGVVAISSGADPTIAVSSDGSTWSPATLPVTERAVAEAVVSWSGGFAIVGRDGQPDQFSEAVLNSQAPPGTGRPAAWISTDGAHWSEATVEGDEVAGAGLGHVVAVRAGLVGVGVKTTDDFYAGALTGWTSADGRRWSIASTSTWPLGRNDDPTFASDGQSTVLVGRAPEGPTLAAWVTVDGLAWSRLTAGPVEDAPSIDCGSHADCVRVDQAWLVPGGVIVAGTSIAGQGGQRVWVATLR